MLWLPEFISFIRLIHSSTFILFPLSGNVVTGAVGGGVDKDGEELYVGRAEVDGNIIPGKIKPSHGVCYIAHEGREVSNRAYQVLTSNGHEFEWIVNKQSARYGWVPGGRTADGRLLHIGRAPFNGSITIGYVLNNHIFIPFDGRIEVLHVYEILCLKQSELWVPFFWG